MSFISNTQPKKIYWCVTLFQRSKNEETTDTFLHMIGLTVASIIILAGNFKG